MPIKSIDKFRCIGCGACEKACPSDVIRMENGKARPVYPEDCKVCMFCHLACPTDAIKIVITPVGFFDQPWRKGEKPIPLLGKEY